MDAVKRTRTEVTPLSVKNAINRKAVRWYLMSYTYGRKGLTVGLEHELKRRRMAGEQPFEYFAPAYIETKEVDGKIVTNKTERLYNYFFVRVNESELFRIKEFQPQYNLFRRITNADGSSHYPYVKDDIIQTLQKIAHNCSGSIPLYQIDQTQLIKGEKIKITKGTYKGVEARIVSRPHVADKEIMVFIDNWMCVPLFNVRPSQYEVISPNSEKQPSAAPALLDNAKLAQDLHEALCRHLRKETLECDRKLAAATISNYGTIEAGSAIQRCKLYTYLLPACTILEDKEKKAELLKQVEAMLPTITAEQSLALLLVTLYGCTADSRHQAKAHQLVAPWAKEKAPKKSKQTLLQRLSDYEKSLGR